MNQKNQADDYLDAADEVPEISQCIEHVPCICRMAGINGISASR
jgi:hypothetical protein